MRSFLLMSLSSSAAILLALLLCMTPQDVAAAAEKLNAETFKDYVGSGKNGMIKFFQTWCGHCTAMKPAWDQLAEEAHPSVFIKDVDCGEEKELCRENRVSGYPTIMVYRNGEEERYRGGRGLEELLEFVDANLAVTCNVTDRAECSEKAKKYLEKWEAKEATDIARERQRLEGMAGSTMTSALKQWMRERIRLLKELAPAEAVEL